MLQTWIEHFSYIGILGGLVLGGLGIPIPEEAVIIAAGVLAHQGVVHWWLAWPLCFLGVLAGDCLLYLAGHRWGDRVLQGRPFRWLLSERRLDRLKAAYRLRGLTVVITARHVMGVRAAAMLGAGIVRIPFWKFLVADAAAALPSVGAAFGLAFLLTDRLQGVLAEVHRVEHWLLLGLVLAALGWLIWRRQVARRIL